MVAGALRYAAVCARGSLLEKAREEFQKARSAGLDAILKGLSQLVAPENSAESIAPPPEKVVTEEITGVEILVLEEAVRILWKRGLYATSGMGCTGPVIDGRGGDLEAAVAALKAAGYL